MSRHLHLKRLSQVWPKQPVYFITVCVAWRRHLLANRLAHGILQTEWTGLLDRHGWAVGRYVVMPDHVHFFITPAADHLKALSFVVGTWKEWTAKRLLKATQSEAPFWQPEFSDHLMRSPESRTEKWNYIRDNPVRAGLVPQADEWPYAGAIDFE